MSDEKKNITENGVDRAVDSMDRLRSADRMLSAYKGGVSASHIGADEREARVSEAQDKMRENIERAGKEAAERRALAESKNEYKQDILLRESKRVETERRERESALAEERRERAKLCEEERERYLAREREENERIGEGVSNLLAKIGIGKDAPSADLRAAVEAKEIKADGGSAPSKTACDSPVKTADTEKITVTVGKGRPSVSDSSDSMILNIGAPSLHSSARVSLDDSMVLNIGGARTRASSATETDDNMILNIGFGGYAPHVTAYGREGYIPSRYYTRVQPRVNFSGELRAAEERHFERKREAVSAAAGIYEDELRLLAEEEARYTAEIAEIKARRSEYSEWLSELDADAHGAGGYAADAEFRQRETGAADADSEHHAREFEKHREASLADSKVREEDLVREYDRYVEAFERGTSDQTASRQAGEALPYSSRSSEHTQTETEAPRYDPHYDEYEATAYEGAQRAAEEPYASDFGAYIPIGYGTDSDRHAVRAYEAEMLRRENASRKNAERGVEKTIEDDQKEIEDADKIHAYKDSGLDFYARSQLTKRVDKFFKEESVLTKRKKKIIAEQAKASHEENVQLIVEKIAIAKELCELSADVLSACVYVGSRAKTGKHKRILTDYIDSYNQLCDEYETATGRPLDRIEQSMIDDVMAGKIYRPIQNVYYHGMEDDNTRLGLTPEIERDQRRETEDSLISEEYARYVEEGYFPELTASEKRAASKRRSDRMSAVKRAAERDVLLISLRTEYRISDLEAKRDVLLYSFDMEKKDRQKEIQKIEKQIARIKDNERKAAALERADNSRYYYLTAVDASEEKVKKGARRERLEALRLRLDVLLSERESINERLIALYGGTDGRLKKTKVARKAKNVRRKAAKAMHRRQRELARKIEKIKAPIDMKARAYELLNKRIADAAEYESARYSLKTLNPGGRAREELVRTMKTAKKNVRSGEREINFMIKRLKKHEERYRDEREWAGFLIVLAVIAGLGIAAWIFFGDSVMAYINELRAYFGF